LRGVRGGGMRCWRRLSAMRLAREHSDFEG
jgi:hypothetical protein